MSRIDGGLRKLHRDNLRAGWMWTSIETGGTGRGISDSHFVSHGCSGWVEFKLENATGMVGLTPEQIAWIDQYLRCGGRVFVAVRMKHEGGPRKGAAADELWLLHGGHAREIRTQGLVLGAPWVLGRWSGGPAAWNWPVVGGLLLR